MNNDLLADLACTMAAHGFCQVVNSAPLPGVTLLLKRQTWNTNRAIVVVSPSHLPTDLRGYLGQLRRRVAFRCGFFPFFWGIGIQVVFVVADLSQSGVDLARYVARVDNQWAIVQSIFLADPVTCTYQEARTWGQLVTGKFQDAISMVLCRHFPSNPNGRHA